MRQIRILYNNGEWGAWRKPTKNGSVLLPGGIPVDQHDDLLAIGDVVWIEHQGDGIDELLVVKKIERRMV